MRPPSARAEIASAAYHELLADRIDTDVEELNHASMRLARKASLLAQAAKGRGDEIDAMLAKIREVMSQRHNA